MYTKGEWKVDTESPLTVLAKVGEGYSLICDCSNPWQPKERKEANAHLIAAAPDMYKALKQIQKWLLDGGAIKPGQLLNEQFVKANNLTVKALSKADKGA